MLPSESAAEFAAFAEALIEELAPEGALQAVLAQRIVAASWRLARSERLEAQLFAENQLAGRSIGLALIRDCNGARSFDTLLRYRSSASAELWRALRTLKALQAERAVAGPEPAMVPEPRLLPEPQEVPVEPESRANLGVSARPGDRGDPEKADPRPAPIQLLPTAGESAPCVPPIEPERREQPAQAAPPSLATDRVELPKLLHPVLCST